MTSYQDSLRARLREMPVKPPPAPWEPTIAAPMGGLLAVGSASAADGRLLLLAISAAGRGLFDIESGERVARDSEPLSGEWIDESALRSRAIGPLADQWIAIAGIWGGGLSTFTHDRWSTEIVTPDWPQEIVLLQPPAQPGDAPYERAHAVVRGSTEVRAAGFIEDGRTFVVATTSELLAWRRP